jgi:hypothetical protein
VKAVWSRLKDLMRLVHLKRTPNSPGGAPDPADVSKGSHETQIDLKLRKFLASLNEVSNDLGAKLASLANLECLGGTLLSEVQALKQGQDEIIARVKAIDEVLRRLKHTESPSPVSEIVSPKPLNISANDLTVGSYAKTNKLDRVPSAREVQPEAYLKSLWLHLRDGEIQWDSHNIRKALSHDARLVEMGNVYLCVGLAGAEYYLPNPALTRDEFSDMYRNFGPRTAYIKELLSIARKDQAKNIIQGELA